MRYLEIFKNIRMIETHDLHVANLIRTNEMFEDYCVKIAAKKVCQNLVIGVLFNIHCLLLLRLVHCSNHKIFDFR